MFFILGARRLSRKLLKQGYLMKRLKPSFRKFYGRYGDFIQQYEFSLSRISNDIQTPNQQWPLNRSDFPPFHDLYTELDLHRIMSGFRGAFVAGVACQQGTFTLPDTWFRPPFGTCLCFNVKIRFPELTMSLLDFSPWVPLGTFSILLNDIACKECLLRFHLRRTRASSVG